MGEVQVAAGGGGVLGANGSWKAAKGNYLFPVKALSRHFRGRLVSLLRGS
jgi:hypothetical protein